MRVVSAVPTHTGEEGEHLLYVSGTLRRLYWYDITNSTWHYVEWNGSGLGAVAIPATVQLTGQTGNIAATTIFTPPAVGFFRVSVYMLCSTAGSGGSLTSVISWTDHVGVKTNSPAGAVDLTATTNGTTGDVFIRSTAAAITYATTITGGAGNPQYSYHLALEQIA